MSGNDLPDPISDQLVSLVAGSRQRALYGLLFRRRANPPSEKEIAYFLADVAGEDSGDLETLLAPLDNHFRIARTPDDPPRYRLDGWQATDPDAVQQPISLRLRAEVLSAQRCAQCGRTPSDHAVVLSPAQKIPLSWGGTPDRHNLEPLCEDCAIGRQQYFQKWDHAADKIRMAVDMDDPRQRMGELLRAMSPEWVRADLLEAVACAKEYQDDWPRRLRDLRFLGWDYEHRNEKTELGRTWAFYRFKQSAPWPSNIHAAIKRETERRSASKRAKDVLS